MKKTDIAPWGKQLLISILGTAIGLGLTFAVDRMVENHKQERAQHETAIMAVCDIDEIIRQLKDEKHMEDSLFHVAMYVSTHQEQIDLMSEDTLDMAFRYLYDDPAEVKDWTVDTKENAFNSGMEARKNLGNNKFYDNVQSCYYVRRSLMKKMEQDPIFGRPVASETYEQYLQQLGHEQIDENKDGKPYLEARKKLMKKIFAQGETMIYIKRFFPRREAYRRAISELELLNRENKLLMNISKEDIEEYIRENKDLTHVATADLIVGSWESKLEENWTFVFHADSTIETTLGFVSQMTAILEQENMQVFVPTPMTLRLKGLWELKGDTLKIKYDGQKTEILSFDMDTSNFPESAKERLKDSMDIKIQEGKEAMTEMFKLGGASIFNDTCVISFDKSGNTMVCSQHKSTPPQLYRVE